MSVPSLVKIEKPGNRLELDVPSRVGSCRTRFSEPEVFEAPVDSIFVELYAVSCCAGVAVDDVTGD